MALIFLGSSTCEICGKILEEGDEIKGLPPMSNTEHPLWKHFDAGFHKACYDSWDKRKKWNS